jgi:ectoine hydroxylase-related dioxygenase (phytanoyl-CoA dioxygenase family)
MMVLHFALVLASILIACVSSAAPPEVSSSWTRPPAAQKGPNVAFTADFTGLSLPVADAVANAAIEEATRRNFAPVTVVVVDPAGRVIVHKRMDHCANGPAAFAQAKVVKDSLSKVLLSHNYLLIYC